MRFVFSNWKCVVGCAASIAFDSAYPALAEETTATKLESTSEVLDAAKWVPNLDSEGTIKLELACVRRYCLRLYILSGNKQDMSSISSQPDSDMHHKLKLFA